VADPYKVQQFAAQWRSTGASPEEIEACGGALECWSWFPYEGQPASLRVAESGMRDWEVLTEEPLGPADDQVAAENHAAARGILIALLDGMAEGVPVVVSAPAEHFRIGSPLFACVDFARRALPGELRRRCRIRCFAKNLARYFEEFRADMVVIPISILQTAVGFRRDAILLDHLGSRISMEKERHSDYGNIVCEQLMKDPSRVADFLRRLNRFIPGPPSAPQTYLLRLLGALSRGEGNQQIPERFEILDVDWAAAIEPADLAQFQTESLCRLALELDALRALSIQEIERRRAPLPWTVDWDSEVGRRPGPAVDLLLASGDWQKWRASTRGAADLLQQAAVHWCGSSHWQRHQPFLEDWVVIVRDLGKLLKPGDIWVMSSRGERAEPYPPITFFEERQARDVAVVQRSRTEKDETLLMTPDQDLAVEEPPPSAVVSEKLPESRWERVRGWWHRIGSREDDDD
jgi:hypothetical protein